MSTKGGSGAKQGARSTRNGRMQTTDALSLYEQEIGRYPLLTPDEEKELAKAVEQGDEGAKRRLTESNLRLVVSVALRFANRGLPVIDLVQEGNVGLIRAVEKFDWKKGNRFSTYAVWWIQQAVRRALSDQSRTVRLPAHISDKVGRLVAAQARLWQQHGREPRRSELAEALEMPAAEVGKLMRYAQETLSFETPIGTEGSTLDEFIADDDAASPESDASGAALTGELQRALARLPETERRVLELRFGLGDGESRTLEEVGKAFGVTRERARQIQRKALGTLKESSDAPALREYLIETS